MMWKRGCTNGGVALVALASLGLTSAVLGQEACDNPPPGAGDCTVATPGIAGCTDADCCTIVCALEPSCCDEEWDAGCAFQADSSCIGPPCTGCGTSSDCGDCFVANGTPFCDDEACCNTVCAVDPFCCDSSWDALCAGEALDFCDCLPADAPPNDLCANAIEVFLDTPLAFDNDCATAGLPDHATCNDGFVVGLGLDIWYVFNADYTGDLLVSLCDASTTFDTQLAVYAGDCNSLEDPPLGCNNDGLACANGNSEVAVEVVDGNAYMIRVGGTFTTSSGTGLLTLTSDTIELCELEIPIGGVVEEPEPCGDDVNGGCNNDPDPATYTDIASGDLIHGTGWADGGTRDTDWYRLEVTAADDVDGDGVVQICFLTKSEFPAASFIADITGGCPATILADLGFSTNCEVQDPGIEAVAAPGTYVVFVGAGNSAGGAVFSDIPCGGPVGNDYLLCVNVVDDDETCPTEEDCFPSGAKCPWDLSGNGNVGPEDLASLLGAWGNPYGPAELAQLLGSWGPCL